MSLDILTKFDPATSNAILAAAALSTSPRPGLDDDTSALISEYKDEVSALLDEIRQKLSIKKDDTSPKARLSIDDFLSRALERAVFVGGKADAALSKAAQAGRLSPAAYKVIQPELFRQRFYPFAITKAQVEEAIHQPDDYQHLLTEGAPDEEIDVFSLFMKRAGGKGHVPNWVLVQAFRRGLEQVAQSAWRIYPDEINLEGAEAPLDVLAAFAEKFGNEVRIGNKRGKFIETMSMSKNPDSKEMQFEVGIQTSLEGNYFYSWSNRRTTDPALFKVGLIYSIDMELYRASLRAHGAGVQAR